MASRAVELYWTREWDDWTGFSNALKYTLILSVVQWAFWFHACFKGSVLPLFISGEKKCLLWLKAPFCVCSSVLCASIYNTNECGHMYVFSFSYTQTHTSSLCLLKWEKECYSTANCCRIQTQASTHCLPYRTSVCTKSKPVELFARITSSHRGKASFMHAKLTNFENHQIKWSLLSQNHTHPSDTTTFCLCVRIMLTHDWWGFSHQTQLLVSGVGLECDWSNDFINVIWLIACEHQDKMLAFFLLSPVAENEVDISALWDKVGSHRSQFGSHQKSLSKIYGFFCISIGKTRKKLICAVNADTKGECYSIL